MAENKTDEQKAAEAAAAAQAEADAKAAAEAEAANIAAAAQINATNAAATANEPKPKTENKDEALKAKIAKLVGVKLEQVIGFNADRRTLVTSEGGKYQLSEDGKKLRHLMGPAPKVSEA